jgi:Predicted solute binding protein
MKTNRYKQALALLISAISTDFLEATEHFACNSVESLVCEKVITVADANSPDIPYNFKIDEIQDEEHTDTLVGSHKARHFCEVREENAKVNGFAPGTIIELVNVPDSFQDEMVEHVGAGYTELIISKGKLCGSKLKISYDVENDFGEVVIDQLNQDIQQTSVTKDDILKQVNSAMRWEKPHAFSVSVRADRSLQVDPSACFDDPDFWFIRDNNMTSTCAWLTEEPTKKDIRIGKYCDRPHVKYACPYTCLELQDLHCECPSNNPNFEFVMLNVVPEKNQTCSWITKNSKHVETRRENYCYSDYRKVPVEGDESVGENCIDSCFCTGGFRSSSPSTSPSDLPTVPPSVSPTVTPSHSPTLIPSSTPSSFPSSTCFDDPDFWFIRDNKMNSTCAWLTDEPDRQDIRIGKYCDRPHVKYACPYTCLELRELPCECPSDNPNFEFLLLNVVPETNQTCSWITKNSKQVETRRDNYCYSDYRKTPVEGDESVGENCIDSCFCTGGFRSSSPSTSPSDLPTVPPSVSPTVTPSHSPTFIPSSTPSSFPSSTCFDDPDFWFIRDNKMNSTCAWLTDEPDRQDIRIGKYCDRPHVKYACPYTCLELRELPCECPSDNPNFEFLLLNVVPERNQTCSWITKNSKHVETRRDNYCYSDYRKTPVEGDESVGENCIDSCFCTGGFRTASPSISPSDLTTEPPSPSVRPSNIQRSFDSSTCVDDPDFWFIRDNNMTSTCDWLTDEPDRQDARISRYCDRPHVKYACPYTCLELRGLTCECPNNTPNFEFVMLNVVPEKNQTCSWITKNSKNVETRRENYCYSDYRKVPVEGDESVGENCIDSCFCTGSFLSRSPSLAPSDVPTKTPSMSPSKSPSASPTDEPSAGPSLFPSVSPTARPSITPSSFPSSTCFDDPDFWFIRDNNMTSTCAWLTDEPDRQDARISRYCDRPHVKYACPYTCLELRGLTCECPNNTPNFEFVMLNVVPEKNQTCSWITKNSKNVETRRENYCYSDYRKVPVEGDGSVGENCIDSCFCTGGFRSSSPSLAPSDVPTKTPSMSPSKTPSVNPTDVPSVSPSSSPSVVPSKTPSRRPSSTKAPTFSPSSTKAPVSPSSTKAPTFSPSSTKAPVAPSSTKAPVMSSTKAPTFTPSSTKAPVAPSSTKAPVTSSTKAPTFSPTSSTKAPISVDRMLHHSHASTDLSGEQKVISESSASTETAVKRVLANLLKWFK